uniref:Uncharacterized protein n=1 Tax=Anguilla anguilla TaxID=7936 RepID=A0A0E9Q8T1_ANGAN
MLLMYSVLHYRCITQINGIHIKLHVQFHVCFLPIATFKAIMANNNNCKQ